MDPGLRRGDGKKMIIEDLKNISSTKRDLRNFGLVVGVCFAAIGAIALFQGHNYGLYLIVLGVMLFVLGLVLPRSLLLPQKAWMSFATVLGFIMSRVILFLVFSIVIVPVGVLRKLAGGRFLDDRFHAKDRTYWQSRPKRIFSKEDWEKQF